MASYCRSLVSHLTCRAIGHDPHAASTQASQKKGARIAERVIISATNLESTKLGSYQICTHWDAATLANVVASELAQQHFEWQLAARCLCVCANKGVSLILTSPLEVGAALVQRLMVSLTAAT
eukprot:5824530-Amphidinium_carterae.1